MSTPESKSISSAIKTLEAIVKGWEDEVIPPDHFVKGVEMLERWKEEISSNSSKETENSKQEI